MNRGFDFQRGNRKGLKPLRVSAGYSVPPVASAPQTRGTGQMRRGGGAQRGKVAQDHFMI